MIKAVSKITFIREFVRKHLAIRRQERTQGLHAYEGYPYIGVFEEGYEIGPQHIVMHFQPYGTDYLVLDQHFHRSRRGTEELLRVATEIAQAASKKISAKTRAPAYIGVPDPRRFAPWYVQRSGEAENQ